MASDIGTVGQDESVDTVEHCTVADPDLVAAVRALGERPDAVLLAAHAKVRSVLTGNDHVLVGYATPHGVLPCRLTLRGGSWFTLLDDVRRAMSAAGSTASLEPIDTVLEIAGYQADSPDLGGHRLWVRFDPRTGRFRLWCRVDAPDTDRAAGIAGYHRAALAFLTGNAGADHTRCSLLSARERDFQLNELAGPTRALPDSRVHELFEDRVRRHPDAVAAMLGETRWTYAELNGRANRLGHALLSRGLRAEDVVAVVTERDLDWLVSVLAIFKAGGVYLPIEPHFPTDRIARILARADASFVLTARGSDANLTGDSLLIEDLCREDHQDTNPGKPVAADQLAYIYFTSGSTGEPKGAMCEHAGLVNHIYAKIEDLEIGDGCTVAQTAPQCFDISLWQLMSALLVGGRTLIVEQDAILDVERFVDTIAGGAANVVQLVPSYLDTVLAYLAQRPSGLPHLRCMSVTGEALKKDLVVRWFQAFPGTALVNAYGLTETSDDTNHEVLRAVPDRDAIPLGRPVRNVRVYVVDEALNPVPFGAPGEIVFSGVCVGRGYVNDPERSLLAFLDDPHRPGERLYRSGDFGRWLPDGRLEFLGRRDAQVKIRGFRIEIGEIENRLVRVAGVRDGAVVVVESGSDGTNLNANLVAFYTASTELRADSVRSTLAESLPEYMVPAVVHAVDALPLTDNGKIDKKALVAHAAKLGTDTADEPPRTASERRIAEAWAQVLRLAPHQVARTDHFYDRGGTSLAAVRLMMRLNRELALADLTANPVLADLAAVLDRKRAALA
jgi:amino acid adenylation domain-containing protein